MHNSKFKYIFCNIVIYEDAVEYRNRRRNIGPVLHNHRRLAELPIPDINLNQQAHTEEENIGQRSRRGRTK